MDNEVLRSMPWVELFNVVDLMLDAAPAPDARQRQADRLGRYLAEMRRRVRSPGGAAEAESVARVLFGAARERATERAAVVKWWPVAVADWPACDACGAAKGDGPTKRQVRDAGERWRACSKCIGAELPPAARALAADFAAVEAAKPARYPWRLEPERFADLAPPARPLRPGERCTREEGHPPDGHYFTPWGKLDVGRCFYVEPEPQASRAPRAPAEPESQVLGRYRRAAREAFGAIPGWADPQPGPGIGWADPGSPPHFEIHDPATGGGWIWDGKGPFLPTAPPSGPPSGRAIARGLNYAAVPIVFDLHAPGGACWCGNHGPAPDVIARPERAPRADIDLVSRYVPARLLPPAAPVPFNEIERAALAVLRGRQP